MPGLIIDTSTERALLAISDQGTILASINLIHQNQLSKILFPSILGLLEQCSISLKNLNFISPGVGPGSYTGTRAGAMIAKGLAFALDIPLIGFNSLEAFTPAEQMSFSIMIKTKMEEVYILEGKKKGPLINFSSPFQILCKDLPSIIQSVECIVSFNPQELREHFRSFFDVEKLEWKQAVFNPHHLALSLFQKFQNGEFSKDNLELIYFYNRLLRKIP